MRYRDSGRQPVVYARRVVSPVLLALVVASCTGGGAVAPSESSSAGVAAPTTSAAPSPGEVAGRAAVAAYIGMWQAMARAGEASDWQSPELAGYATGNALTTITRSLYADHVNQVVTRGTPVNSPVVRSAEPPAAPAAVLIDDCGDSTNWIKYRAGTDEPAGDGSGGGRRVITAEVLLQPDGSWRVNRFAVQELGTC